MRTTERGSSTFQRHSAATLDHLDVPAREKEEVLGFFTSLRGEIVEAP
jgi:hypothetical protein